MTSPAERRAHVVGLGLIGASVARALAGLGWSVTGDDADPATRAAALATRASSRPAASTTASTLAVVATPASSVSGVAGDLLARSARASLVVTDVAGVKASIVAEVTDPRFLGGHPMAGSEQPRPGRRARRPLHRVHLGPHPDAGDVAGDLQRAARGAARARRERGRRRRRGPRPPRRAGQPRAAPRRRRADERGGARGRVRRRPAAAGRRGLPRHDARGRRATPGSGPTSCVENREAVAAALAGARGAPGRPARGDRDGRTATRWPRGCARPAPRAGACPGAPCTPTSSPTCASRCRTPRASSPRSRPRPASAPSTSTTSRSPTASRASPARCSWRSTPSRADEFLDALAALGFSAARER